MKPSDLVLPDERLELEEAIADVERRTAGEIVVVVVAKSADYESVAWRLGVAAAAAALLGAALAAPGLPVSAVLALQTAAVIAGLWFGRTATVQHHMVSDASQDAAVTERARRSFAEHGLTRTAGRTGVLIFVSLLERRVVVLADEGIDRVLDPTERWDDIVGLVVSAIREGRVAEGLEAAVRRCGEILAAHVPVAREDRNELRNTVVLED